MESEANLYVIFFQKGNKACEVGEQKGQVYESPERGKQP